MEPGVAEVLIALIVCVVGPIASALSGAFLLWAFIRIGHYASKLNKSKRDEEANGFDSPTFRYTTRSEERG